MIRNNGRGSLPAREKPVDQGSNPCVPTPISESYIENKARRLTGIGAGRGQGAFPVLIYKAGQTLGVSTHN